MTLKGNIEAALDFLRRWKSEGPWVLTSITVDGPKRTDTRTFRPANERELRNWLDVREGKENIYFMVNTPLTDLNNKASKTDLKSMDALHVDIDPRPGEELKAERERALRVLKAYAPPPSIIIDSGGGYQGFWRLSEPAPVNGDEAAAIELEAYNIQIELQLGADACHNLDRIMRLPGTLNVPDEKKRRKGRSLALASVVEADWKLAYPLTAFTAAPRVQNREGHINSTDRVQLSGNLGRLGSVDDLPDSVSARTKMLIVQGEDPDDPGRYPSRSETVWAVCCEMVRAGCTDDIIATVLLDPDFAISGHVLAQKRPQEYAARQIKRAREEAVSPHLRELNERHAVIEDLGGKCRVVSEVMDMTLKRPHLTRQSFDDFRNRYMHIMVEVGRDEDGQIIKASLGKFWLTNPHRRQYRTLVFAPGREIPDAYNLWRGFACEARPGKCDLFLQHVLENICGGNTEHYDYLMNWMARAVQSPAALGETAVVLRGRMGAGKSKYVKIFGSLWGRHFLQVTDPKHLVGSFNAHLQDCVVLFGDEAFYAGDRKHESILKALVTEGTFMVEAKGIDAQAAPNFLHILLASNSDWVVPAGADDRRYFVLDVGDGKLQNAEFFAALDREMDSGGREALLHNLMTRDLKTFEVRLVPKTEALKDQKLHTLGPVEEWWFEKLSDGKVLHNGVEWITEVTKDDLQTDLIRYLERQKIMRRPSPAALGKFLKKVMPKGLPRGYQKVCDVTRESGDGREYTVKTRAYFYQIATLVDCRARWDERFGGPYPWLDAEVRDTVRKAPF